jgi:hypothetical protein
MVKSYTDNDVFQKIVVISPTVQFDEKFKILPLTEVYEEYSDELLGQIMEQQKEDMDKYKPAAPVQARGAARSSRVGFSGLFSAKFG